MIDVKFKNSDWIKGISLPEIEMNFLNGGKITIPNKFGAYVVATGCGSGKTTIIKRMIPELCNDGIVYSASTISECNDMFTYCYNLCTNPSINPKPFTLKDIILLHSGDCPIEECRDEFNNWKNIYKNNPEEIRYKKIVICTHHKLLNTHPATFLRYEGNRYVVDMDDLSPIEKSITSECQGNIKKYPRQLILIDELPSCNTFQFIVDPAIIRLLANEKHEIFYVEHPEPGEDHYQTRPIYPKVLSRPKGFSKFNILYNQLIKGTKHEIWGSLTVKDENILELAKSMIYDNFNDIINSSDPIPMRYNISDFVLDRKMETRILLFEGTGDLTFYNSRRLKLLTFSNKYSSPINIEKFHSHLNRKQVKTEDLTIIESGIDCNVNELDRIIRNNEKTLIVTWKNFKDNGDINNKNTYSISSTILNSNLSLPDIYTNRLIVNKGISPSKFEVIHYMSGLDKAVNKFREFDSIVFLGKFRVPNCVVGEFNRDYRVETSCDKFSLYQLVQAITRTRIRNHKGESINVYFSDDWDNGIIRMTESYLSGKDTVLDNTKKDLSEAYNELMSWIRPKWRKDIDSLMSFSDEFKDAILRRTGYVLNISLDDIYSISPKSEKKVKMYFPLSRYLSQIGIELNIEVNKTNNNQYTTKKSK